MILIAQAKCLHSIFLFLFNLHSTTAGVSVKVKTIATTVDRSKDIKHSFTWISFKFYPYVFLVELSSWNLIWEKLKPGKISRWNFKSCYFFTHRTPTSEDKTWNVKYFSSLEENVSVNQRCDMLRKCGRKAEKNSSTSHVDQVIKTHVESKSNSTHRWSSCWWNIFEREERGLNRLGFVSKKYKVEGARVALRMSERNY